MGKTAKETVAEASALVETLTADEAAKRAVMPARSS